MAPAGLEGLTLTADMEWTGTEKVKAKGLQSCSVNSPLETASLNFPSPVVKITVRALGSHGQEASERCLVIDTVAVGYRQSLPCCHAWGLSEDQRASHIPCSLPSSFPGILYPLWNQTIHPQAATALPKPSTAPFGRGDRGPTMDLGTVTGAQQNTDGLWGFLFK